MLSKTGSDLISKFQKQQLFFNQIKKDSLFYWKNIFHQKEEEYDYVVAEV